MNSDQGDAFPGDREPTMPEPFQIPTLFEDDLFTLTPCESHPVPGYLILSGKGSEASMGALLADHAAQLGCLLSRAVRSIEAVVETDRVYVLSFGESGGPFHMHLFPRTRWVLEAYQRQHENPDGPIDGPAVFEWARRCLRSGLVFPNTGLQCDEASERIRALLHPHPIPRRVSGVHLQAERLERP